MTRELHASERLRLLVDPPAAGAWNMSVDEMLMERAADAGEATLRFYQWSPATLSLGYFQGAAERAEHGASGGCPLVRRSSGGGAIVHDRELTYSLSLPTTHRLAADAETLYRNVHATLIKALAVFGVAARMNEAATVPFGGEPFLCFQRRAVGDVLVDRWKICGSAQRRRRGAILQHGRVLIARSPAAPELPGLIDLAGEGAASTLTPETLTEAWQRELVAKFGEMPAYGALSPRDMARAEAHRREKYGADAWTNRR